MPPLMNYSNSIKCNPLGPAHTLVFSFSFSYSEKFMDLPGIVLQFSGCCSAAFLKFLQPSVSVEKLWWLKAAPACFRSHVGLSVSYLLRFLCDLLLPAIVSIL